MAIKDIIISDDFNDTDITLVFADGSKVTLNENDYVAYSDSAEKFHI